MSGQSKNKHEEHKSNKSNKSNKSAKSDNKHKAKMEVSEKSESKKKSSKTKKDIESESENESDNNQSDEEVKSKTSKSKKNKTRDTNSDDEIEAVEAKDGRNHTTMIAGCEFNVNMTKSWMVEYLSRYTVPMINKVTGEKFNKPVTVYKLAATALTGVDEVLTSTVLNLAGARVKKGPDGLIRITEENMMDIMRLDKNLCATFGHFIGDYDNTQKYQKEVDIKKADLTRFVETKCLNGNSSVTLDPSAQNFLMFLIRKSRTLLTECAFQMSQCYNKTGISEKSIMYSIKIVFAPGTLQKNALIKAHDASERVKADMMSKSKSTKEKDGKKGKQEKSSKSSKNAKSKKHDSDAEESEEENESESDAEEEEEEDEENESEEENESDDD